MNSPLLNLLERIHARSDTSTPVLDVVRRVVNSPVVSLVVKATPNPIDDMVLAFLQAVLPATPPAPAVS